jgi:hypothetical protein
MRIKRNNLLSISKPFDIANMDYQINLCNEAITQVLISYSPCKHPQTNLYTIITMHDFSKSVAAGAYRGFELNQRPPEQRQEGGQCGVTGGGGWCGGGPTTGLGGGADDPTEVASREVVARRQGWVAVNTTSVMIRAGGQVQVGGGSQAGGQGRRCQ